MCQYAKETVQQIFPNFDFKIFGKFLNFKFGLGLWNSSSRAIKADRLVVLNFQYFLAKEFKTKQNNTYSCYQYPSRPCNQQLSTCL